MPTANTPLPCVTIVGRGPSDQYKTILTNLSYPSRLHTHVPWAGPSAPLVISKTESVRYQTSFVPTNGTSGATVAGSAGSGFHASFEAHIWSLIKRFISHAASNFVQMLKNLKERLSVPHLSLL